MNKKAAHPLHYAVRLWFIVICLGQSIFAYYILMQYYRNTALGDLEKWNNVNPHFYDKSDLTGNIIFGLHVALAAVITILGPLQLVPSLRARVPRFHRISGRVYIASAFLVSVAGIYLTWVRGAVGGPVMQLMISANAAIILICAYFAIRSAMERRFKVHQQWAVHLFLGMSGVWMFRVFLMLWLLIHRAPVGFDPKTFTGPFLTVLAVTVYIMPQAIAAWYFGVRGSGPAYQRTVFATFLTLVSLGMAVGSFAATMGMWMPRVME